MQRWHRKKQFNFADLVKYMQSLEMSDIGMKTQLAKELNICIAPKLKDKMKELV